MPTVECLKDLILGTGRERDHSQLDPDGGTSPTATTAPSMWPQEWGRNPPGPQQRAGGDGDSHPKRDLPQMPLRGGISDLRGQLVGRGGADLVGGGSSLHVMDQGGVTVNSLRGSGGGQSLTGAPGGGHQCVGPRPGEAMTPPLIICSPCRW